MAASKNRATQGAKLAGLLTPRERVWAALRKAGKGGKPFTVDDVQAQIMAMQMPMVIYHTLRQALNKYAASGHLSKTPPAKLPGKSTYTAPCFYTLLKDQLSPPASAGKRATDGMGKLAMWRAMHVLKTFDAQELARAATAGVVNVPLSTARVYLSNLLHAGYLQRLPQDVIEKTAHAVGRYRLIKRTGEKAPLKLRSYCVLDRNTGELHPLKTAQELTDGIE